MALGKISYENLVFWLSYFFASGVLVALGLPHC